MSQCKSRAKIKTSKAQSTINCSPLNDEDYSADVVEGGSNPSIFEDYDDGFGADNGGGGDYNYDEDYFGETGGFRSTVRRGYAWG